MSGKKELLDELRDELQGSSCCPLAAGRSNLVFGDGDPDASVMFVGEAPGFHEDRFGIPFVGQAGKLLDELLAGIGLDRSRVYIANVLKCRPPANRDPEAAEIELCKGFLFRQIEMIGPQLICTLGNFATKLLTGDDTGISRVHGREREVNGLRIFPIYHPAAALHNPHLKKALLEDFAELGRLLKTSGGGPANDVGGSTGEQLSLWD